MSASQTMDGIETRDGMVGHNLTMTSEANDIRGINCKTIILDYTYAGTFPSASVPVTVETASPVTPTVSGDVDVVEVIKDGTMLLTRIRIPATGAKVLYPVVELTWAWTAPY